MKATELTIKATRVLGDRRFGNYEVEARVHWKLEGDEGKEMRLPDTMRQATAMVRTRVLESVREMQRDEEQEVPA